MSIVRVGLAETKNFAEGYEAIFGSKSGGKKPAKPKAASRASKSKPRSKKKSTAKKK